MTDYARIIGPVARILLGEPNARLSSAHELRYGTNGSLSIDTVKGVWRDHETGKGGGVFDLVVWQKGVLISEAPRWITDQGLELDDDRSFHHATNGAGPKITFGTANEHKANGTGHKSSGDKEQRRQDKIFLYHDMAGNVRFEVVRFVPKGFSQRQPDGNGGHLWNLKGVQLVPYRLPDVTERIAQHHTIFIPEGEKCVDRLWEHGIPASCNPMGAGKWSDDLTPYFAGADVVVIPDFDPQKKHPKTGAPLVHQDGRPILPGQDHALAVAKALSEVASRVRVLDLGDCWPEIKPKGDIFDWFVAGGTVEQFHALVEQAVDWVPELVLRYPADTPPIIDVISAFPINRPGLPVRPWIVPGLLLRGQVTVFVAPPGSGKSMLTLQLSMVCARGSQWHGWVPRDRFKTLIINVEEDEIEMKRRLAGACDRMKFEDPELADKILIAGTSSIVVAQFDARTKTMVATPMLEKIVQTIIALKVDIVVVDPFAETFAGDENSNSELKWAAMLWREVARRTRCAVVLVHHAKKYAQHMAGDMDAARGGGSLAGVARIVSTLFTMTEEEFAQHEECIKKEFPGLADRSRFIRFDDAKANQSVVSNSARWFHKESVGIGNAEIRSDGTTGLPEDEVGVLVPWFPPDPFSNIDVHKANYILDEITIGVRADDGQPTGDPYSPSGRGGSKRWAGLLIQRELGCSKEDAKKIIDKWIDNQLLETYLAPTSTSKGNNMECLKVNNAKRPGTIIEESSL